MGMQIIVHRVNVRIILHVNTLRQVLTHNIRTISGKKSLSKANFSHSVIAAPAWRSLDYFGYRLLSGRYSPAMTLQRESPRGLRRQDTTLI